MSETFPWTTASELAAQLVAEGELTQYDIADRAGVSRQSVFNWRRHPEFAARVASHLEAYRDEIRRVGIAVRETRIKALNDRWGRLNRVIDERSKSPLMQEVPGGSTGLIVHRILKRIGKGDDAVTLESFDVDTRLLAELREIERQAAQELGQWTERVEQTGDTSTTIRYVNDWRGQGTGPETPVA